MDLRQHRGTGDPSSPPKADPHVMLDLDTLTIEEFGRRLRSKELTAEAVTDACLRRIDERSGVRQGSH